MGEEHLIAVIAKRYRAMPPEKRMVEVRNLTRQSSETRSFATLMSAFFSIATPCISWFYVVFNSLNVRFNVRSPAPSPREFLKKFFPDLYAEAYLHG